MAIFKRNGKNPAAKVVAERSKYWWKAVPGGYVLSDDYGIQMWQDDEDPNKLVLDVNDTYHIFETSGFHSNIETVDSLDYIVGHIDEAICLDLN